MEYIETIPTLAVQSVELAASWFERNLGFRILHLNRDPEGEEPTNYGVLQKDKIEVHLIWAAAAKKQAGTDTFTLVVKGIEQLYSSVREKKVKIKEELRETSWGGKDFKIEDLDGNELVVMEKGKY